ncbi:MAG: OB-fold domain-containing protein [Gammaproteobacteria bacterium]|nr:OB-fold domain-containing protein [Gammaproteobacteria bacterium]
MLLGSYSPAAKTYFWPRRKRCPITLQPVEDCELSTEGELYSWTFVFMPTMGSQAKDSGGGFGAAQVDLPEGVRMQALLDGKQGDWTIGMKVRLTTRQVATDDAGNAVCTIGFAPVGEGTKDA